MGLLDPYTAAYPDKMMAHVEIKLADGRTIEKEKRDYKGFITNPFTWNDTIFKMKKLCKKDYSDEQLNNIIEAVENLERTSLRELTNRIELILNED